MVSAPEMRALNVFKYLFWQTSLHGTFDAKRLLAEVANLLRPSRLASESEIQSSLQAIPQAVRPFG